MIKLICIGKLKENYLKELIDDYLKRINNYHKIEIIELKDSNKEEESKLILKNIEKKDYVISLDIKGKKFNSVKFKEKIENLFINGYSDIAFIIGGSEGLDKIVLEISNEIISFSDFTFPHGLFRGILLEQIYRVFKIMNNETYHK